MKYLIEKVLKAKAVAGLAFGCLLAAAPAMADPVKVMIDPSPIVVAPGQKVQLNARLSNLPPSIRLIWSLEAEGVDRDRKGSLSRDFSPSYTAPDNPPDKPIYVQLLAIDDKQGIPVAGAKSQIKFASGGGGGGGSASSQQQQQKQQQQQQGGGSAGQQQQQQNAGSGGSGGAPAWTSPPPPANAPSGGSGGGSGGIIWNDPAPAAPPPPPSSGSSTPGVPRAPPGEWN
jgi:hypothetical protein